MPSLFPTWTSFIGFILGAFIGSFLNMAIYRLPRKLSFVNPSRSFCPKCEHSLSSRDLMPILSWVFAKGKCRYCHDPVSSRYLWVELLTGTLFATIWWRFLTDSYDPIRMVAYLLAAACLVAIIFIDAELYIIPDEINVMILFIALVYRYADNSLGIALTGGLLGWGLLFGVQLLGRLAFKKDAMGDGDIKMMRSVGALLGPLLLIGNFGMAVILGLVGGIIGIAIEKRKSKPAASTLNASEGDSALVEPDWEPTPIPTILFSGLWYLLCLDAVALFVKPLREWSEQKYEQEVVSDDDDWKPSATTIPFGPYLAAGALACMLFAAPIESGLKNYFRLPPPDSGPAVISPLQGVSGLSRETPSRLN